MTTQLQLSGWIHVGGREQRKEPVRSGRHRTGACLSRFLRGCGPMRTVAAQLARLGLILLALSTFPAMAERADRQKPVNIEADKVTVDDVKKIHIFEGRVTLTQGTTMIRGDKIVVTQDTEGFQKGVVTGNLAYFRTRRDGSDDYVEGRAERIEHDDRNAITRFFNRAWVKSGTDEVRGPFIQYNSATESYSVTGGAGSGQGGGDTRVRAVIHPKSKEGTQQGAAVGTSPPDASTSSVSNPKQE